MFGFLRYKAKRIEQERPRDPYWEKVDESWFGEFYWALAGETLHGPLAEFYGDGQLRKLSWYIQGRPSESHNRLELLPGVPEAEVISQGCCCHFYYGWEEVWLFIDDEPENMAEPAFWNDWIRKWIAQISAGQKVNRLKS